MLKATLQQRPFLLLSHHHLSFFPSNCVCFYLHVCLLASLAFSLYLYPPTHCPPVPKISAISADCHIVCVCLLPCLLVHESKVRHVPEEVEWVLWPSVLISSWAELHACVGVGHSCCVKRALTEHRVASKICFIWLVFALLKGIHFGHSSFLKKKSFYISFHIFHMGHFLSRFHHSHMCFLFVLQLTVKMYHNWVNRWNKCTGKLLHAFQM